MKRPLFFILLWLFFSTNVIFAETLVVLNKAEASASLIDLKTGKVRGTVPTGVGPHEVSVTRDGTRALITNYGNRETRGSTLALIDIPKGKVIKTISLGEYQAPHGVQWFANGRDATVTVEGSKALILIDTETGTVKKAISTDQEVSHMLVLSPDEKFAYVTNIGSGTVTVLDLKQGKKITDISTGAGAEGIDITPDGKKLWVTNRQADTISVIDTVTLKVVSTLESQSFPIRAKVTPDGKHVLVSNARSGDIAVFDAATVKELKRIPIPLEAVSTADRLMGQFGNSSVPIGILIHPNGKKAFVAHANADVITVLDLKEWKMASTLKAGKEPDGMGFSPE